MGWNHQLANHPNIAQYTMYLIHLYVRDFFALFLQRRGPPVVALKEQFPDQQSRSSICQQD